MQKIQTISKSKAIDYGDKVVENFWLRINEKSNYQEDNNNLEQIISILIEVQDSVICIQTEQINHPEIVKVIFNASKKRNRIYILSNEKDKDLKQLEGSCLIRYGIKNIGSFILINPNTNSSKGIIFSAPFIETSLANSQNILFDLNKTQVKTLFRFFSDNFWNKAEYEIIDSFDNPKETSEPPLDFLPNIKDFCDTDFVRNELSTINNATIISAPSLQTNDLLNFELLEKSKVFTSLNNNDITLLKDLSKDNLIFANKHNSIRLIIQANNESWLIPKTNILEYDNLFALKLNKTQTTKLKSIIDKQIKNTEFEFNLSKTRKELENKSIRLLKNIDSEIIVKSDSNIDVGNLKLTVLLPKEEFEKQEPEFIDDNISVKINYNWKNIPFFTPDNAKKAKLYSEWEKYEKQFNEFINKIELTINEGENKNIKESLKRWFLGKKQTISKQKEDLELLKSKQLSILEISKRKQIIQKLNELAKNVFANLSEIDIEIKKSDIKTEIENLKKEKEKKETELEIFIEDQERKLKEIELNKKQKLDDFLKKHNKKENDLATFKSDLQRKAGKKNRKKNPKDAEKSQKILNELKDIQGFDFYKKFEDEKQKFEKEIKNIENKIINKEKEFEKVGTEQKQDGSSSLNSIIGSKQNNKDTKKNNEFSIPENIEFLPKVGVLYEQGNNKYLEIEFWEEYEDAKHEAERLNAKLSVKPL